MREERRESGEKRKRRCEKRDEGGAASGEDLLSGPTERTQVQGPSLRTPPLQRPANSPRASTLPPSSSSFYSSFLFFFFLFFFYFCLYLEAREARTTCLLEKSARLPRALINLHSAQSERAEGGDEGGGSSGLPLPVLLGLMLPIKCGELLILLTAATRSPRREQRSFLIEPVPHASIQRKSLALISFRKSGPAINIGWMRGAEARRRSERPKQGMRRAIFNIPTISGVPSRRP